MKRLAFVLITLFAFLAQATMVKPMSVEELTKAASIVIEGQATEAWTSWNAVHTRIYTFTRVRITQTLKGAAADTVVVKQIGGSAGGYTQHVSGVRPMQTGEDALLFLRPSEARDGTMVIVGLMQGHFRFARDTQTGSTIVNNGVLGADQVRSSDGKLENYRGSSLTLGQVEARVKAAARQ
jgi:hypothetical protein